MGGGRGNWERERERERERLTRKEMEFLARGTHSPIHSSASLRNVMVQSVPSSVPRAVPLYPPWELPVGATVGSIITTEPIAPTSVSSLHAWPSLQFPLPLTIPYPLPPPVLTLCARSNTAMDEPNAANVRSPSEARARMDLGSSEPEMRWNEMAHRR